MRATEKSAAISNQRLLRHYVPRKDIDIIRSMTINEPIAVDCVFKNPGMQPRMFNWRNRTYRIAKINGRWHRREGKFLIYCFAVTDEHDNTYEIELNTENMDWELLKIEE